YSRSFTFSIHGHSTVTLGNPSYVFPFLPSTPCLSQVLRQKQVDSLEVKQVSVRRFATFDLFMRKRVMSPEPGDNAGDRWVEYRSIAFPEYSALLRYMHINAHIYGVWPSEEVMAHYCLKKRHMFKGAVCELGGGMTCLAGLMVAICADVKEVLLSDGNEKAIQNVRGVINRNRQAGVFGATDVSSRVVRWDCESDILALEGHFDIIMCADCLFLDQYRASLVDALRRLLRPNGMALVFAPLRGETLGLFCQLAQQAGLCVHQHQQYDTQVWDVHLKVRIMSHVQE
uniref:Calmodulin-lysine N-methyltransferase n=1 Tax=Myripristis murdjan TaxID=586833 RepID=A0A667XI34_9TELE